MIFVSGRKTSSTIWTRFVPLYLNIWPLTVTGLSIPTMMIWLICWQLRLNHKRFVFTWNCVYHPRGLFQVSILLLKYCCTKWRTWADRIIKPIPIYLQLWYSAVRGTFSNKACNFYLKILPESEKFKMWWWYQKISCDRVIRVHHTWTSICNPEWLYKGSKWKVQLQLILVLFTFFLSEIIRNWRDENSIPRTIILMH